MRRLGASIFFLLYPGLIRRGAIYRACRLTLIDFMIAGRQKEVYNVQWTAAHSWRMA
jgi:hypothetical protein